MAEKTDHERVVSAAEAELANTRRLLNEHVMMCDAPGREGLSMAIMGSCPTCRSLSAHLERCREQVELLGREAETGALF